MSEGCDYRFESGSACLDWASVTRDPLRRDIVIKKNYAANVWRRSLGGSEQSTEIIRARRY